MPVLPGLARDKRRAVNQFSQFIHLSIICAEKLKIESFGNAATKAEGRMCGPLNIVIIVMGAWYLMLNYRGSLLARRNVVRSATKDAL